jgi:hypothetical protein
MKISSNDAFEINEFVFSKLKGYPWWPGQIINIEKIGKKLIYQCADPYTKTISKIADSKCIAKFEDNIDYILKNPKGKKHLYSISTAIESYFDGKKIPKKYKTILEDIKSQYKEENNINNNKELTNSKEMDEKEKKEKEKEKKNKKPEKLKRNESNIEKVMNLDEDFKEKETKTIN